MLTTTFRILSCPPTRYNTRGTALSLDLQNPASTDEIWHRQTAAEYFNSVFLKMSSNGLLWNPQTEM